jgi:signal peptidase II
LKKTFFITLVILVLDQWLKIWIKLNFTLGEEVPVLGNWFKLYFTENNGMAFGLEFAGHWGKLFLSVFRIVAVFGIVVYIFFLTRNGKHKGLEFSASLILAGALGNIIDSAFYGMIFTQSTYHSVATFATGELQGYASFLHGKVVDMLYFPLIDIARSQAPAWMPGFLFGPDDHFIFFRPIFNIADSSITVGVAWLLLFERKNLHF